VNHSWADAGFPWQDEALSVATYKPNESIELSGWSPKYFPAQLIQYANPLITPEGSMNA